MKIGSLAGPLGPTSLMAATLTATLLAVGGFANWSGAAIAAVVTAVVAFGWTFYPAVRRAIAIGAWALCVRVLAAAALLYFAPQPPEALLGPDSRGYLFLAREIVSRGFVLGVHPTAALGTNDVGPYYLFASWVGAGADLFGLQVLNSILGALTAVFAYGAARRVVPSYATPIGLVAALDPSLVLLSASGLLKDPSIMCASAVGVLGMIVGMSSESRVARLLAWVLLALALTYLRVSRFYVAAYLEAGLVLALLVAWVAQAPRRSELLAGGLAAIGVAEATPCVFGWPLSPPLLIAQVQHVLGTPAMRYSSPGMTDALLAGAAQGEAAEQSFQIAQGMTDALLAGAAQAGEGKSGSAQLIDIFRRTFGPFIWVLPEQWDRLTIAYKGDYLLYPGTLIWYAVQPYVALGVWSARRDLGRSGLRRWWLLALAVFACVYLVQFALVNLSYRQRDAMLPVFLLIAAAGHLEVRTCPSWRWWYTAYWVGLCLVAVAHLALVRVLRG